MIYFNDPVGDGAQASTDISVSEIPSSFDVKYQEKDSTGTGMYRDIKNLDGQVQVVNFVEKKIDTDRMEYISLP
ncbi:hypothetical protein RU86_GL000523 [Lactococcus piscium]|uniref:Uncharacterized protein n=1 Tax=Pseudolactococcus piscium TaxID=1364 RepID=A0A2A5RXY5_9LACT|nr:hypothetical protein [Lactococcus piscium]PCS06018.1 hypothetical protein RU86_GL000523 [Lactococcus piscium]